MVAMTRMGWLAMVLGATASLGCEVEVVDDTDPTTTTTVEPEQPQSSSCAMPPWSGDFEVGTGEPCFLAIEDGTVVPLIGGPQGGYHIWLGVRCRDCGAYETVTFGVRDPATDTFVNGSSQTAVLELEQGAGYSQRGGVVAYVPGYEFDSGPGMGTDFVGQSLSLYAEISVGDATLSSEVNITVGSVEHVSSGCPDCN